MHITRWMVAGVAAAALAATVLGLPLFPLPGTGALSSESEAAAVCDANAKRANYSFTLTDMNGKSINLADYKGKVILLDFWATWCAPCKIEIPWFVEFHTRYKDKGLVVLGLSVDDPVEKLKPFAARFKMNYPVLVGLDREDVQDAYGPIWGLPTTFLVSRDGKICRKHMGLISKEKFENDIKALL